MINTTSYLCKRCNFTCINYNDIRRHIKKKITCPKKNLEAFSFSNDQLFILTMIPYNNNNHMIDMNEIDFLKESNELWKRKDELFNILENIEKNKLKKCEYCNEEFTKVMDVKRHVLVKCFYDNLVKKKEINNISINSEGDYNNNLNNCILNNNNNITQNIYVDMKPVIPFDDDWDLSKLDDNIKGRLLISKIMYTTLLEEILKNDKNLNVIIDNESNLGVVYKNEKEQYIGMKIKDIMEESMDKLKKHLLDINQNSSKIEFDSDILRYGKNVILTKHSQYIANDNIHNNVNNFLSNIFEKKKDKAVKRSKMIKDCNLSLNGF